MKQLTISLLLFTGIFLHLNAQLTVADDNNVGIGVTAPESELSVNGVGNTTSTLYVENSTASSSQRAAQFYKSASGDTGGDYSFSVLASIAHNGGYKLFGGSFQAYTSNTSNNRTFGVRGLAGNGYDGYNYGVFGYLYGARDGAAIYGCIDGSETDIDARYAGYFKGNVKITGTLNINGTTYTSDINLKKDIRPISSEESKQLPKLRTLTAIKYKFKTPAEFNSISPEVADTMKVDPRTIEYTDDKYTKDRIGLSAQAVQLVYPELVKEGNDGYLSMDYIGLIPVLVEAIKEQDEAILALDKTVQEQAAQIDVLIGEIEKLKNPETSK